LSFNSKLDKKQNLGYTYIDIMFRTRQAPSPTGYLHLGTARQFLFSKLFALAKNGQWFLRLEDTDRNRLQPDSATNMLQALQELGLMPEEGVNLDKGVVVDFYGVRQYGDFGPYIQSERLEIYHKYAQQCIDKKIAYWCYLNPEQKQELQDIKQVSKKPINYFTKCQEISNEAELYQSISSGLNDPKKPALFYKLQRNQEILCPDVLLGTTKFDLSLEEDFVIIKSDSFPTYHFAHIIDDHLMQTTLVLRAQEWYPSIAKHQTLFLDIFGKFPNYCHVPFILGITGNKKMSKRDGGVNMKEDYLDKGYLPEAIINYLAFQGWNPGTEKELYLENTDF
jgi:nondiscriminating glutamyl-tRNA synthetase